MDQIEPDRTATASPRFAGLRGRTAAAVTGAGLLTGGLAGGFLIAHAQTATPSASSGSSSSSSSSGGGSTTAPSGTFRSNEDPTHEAGESAAREAQEDAGQRPSVP